ncbi:MAG: LysR family transcriptional regulator [Methanomicrobia archaeon]|nr:LysR family transcriptional regulator [Methanomicrobia archaeon]MCK4636451.1 LysR family transcriptional regulator [Methanomicrobia archaeon]
MYLRFSCRFWIENENGKYVLGEGSFLLLKEIENTGSLSKAAGNLGMSYSYAWRKIKKIENVVKNRIVKSHRGGREKGQTLLTDYGKDLLSLYKKLDEKIKDLKLDEQIINR